MSGGAITAQLAQLVCHCVFDCGPFPREKTMGKRTMESSVRAIMPRGYGPRVTLILKGIKPANWTGKLIDASCYDKQQSATGCDANGGSAVLHKNCRCMSGGGTPGGCAHPEQYGSLPARAGGDVSASSLSVGRAADRNPSFCFLTMLCVKHGNRQRIAQDGGRDDEGYAVLPEVPLRLLSRPIRFQR